MREGSKVSLNVWLSRWVTESPLPEGGPSWKRAQLFGFRLGFAVFVRSTHRTVSRPVDRGSNVQRRGQADNHLRVTSFRDS